MHLSRHSRNVRFSMLYVNASAGFLPLGFAPAKELARSHANSIFLSAARRAI
jgi:hypothetical protein